MDSDFENSGNEDTDDSGGGEEFQSNNKTKKPINKGRWSKEEDTKLKQYVEEYNEKWDMIAMHFPDRSDVQCQQRWTKVVNPELVKGPWTKEYVYDKKMPHFDRNPPWSVKSPVLLDIIATFTRTSLNFIQEYSAMPRSSVTEHHWPTDITGQAYGDSR
ncbi:hypothetical protein GWI33_011153 [Rhynchophorus ferrugineus]|uniref:Uncharacterized protein n=1 Tax=Rhynchophorus ferrugineus TaxID=354439 RepID=A0A834IL19_RHYFE|nr:hypothetical protein GWI33_011153 [Rhynchophorus ferrugineus]